MTSKTQPTAMLRPMLPADVPVLAAIFQASIESLTDEDYDESQRNAWAAVADDEADFGASLQRDLIIVATLRGAAVGFVALEGSDMIRMLYVYPKVARQGIGTLLCDAIEKLVCGRGVGELVVEASDTSRPFFERRGYEGLRRQTVLLGDCWLGNTRMRKALTKP